MSENLDGANRVIIVVEQGCASVHEQPDGLDVVIVDQDGDRPYWCRQCECLWGADDATPADIDAGCMYTNQPINTCPTCRKAVPT
jgi:hypothetical protein